MFYIKFDGIKDYHLEIPEAEDSSIKSESTDPKVVTIPPNFYIKIPARALSSISPQSSESNIVTKKGGIAISKSKNQSISSRHRCFLDLMIEMQQLQFSIPHHFIAHKIASNSPVSKPREKGDYNEALSILNFDTFNMYTPKEAVIIGLAHGTEGHDLLLVSSCREQVKELIDTQQTSPVRWTWYYTKVLPQFFAKMFEHLKKLGKLDQVRFIDTNKKDLLHRSAEVSPAEQSTARAAAPIIFNKELILERRNKVLATLAFPNFACFEKAFAGLTEEQQLVIQDELTRHFNGSPKNSSGFFDETAMKKIKIYNGFIARLNAHKAPAHTVCVARVLP